MVYENTNIQTWVYVNILKCTLTTVWYTNVDNNPTTGMISTLDVYNHGNIQEIYYGTASNSSCQWCPTRTNECRLGLKHSCIKTQFWSMWDKLGHVYKNRPLGDWQSASMRSMFLDHLGTNQLQIPDIARDTYICNCSYTNLDKTFHFIWR